MIAGRWKVACINWGHSDAPQALTYHWDGVEMRAERYWPSWSDAIAHVFGGAA